MLPGRMQMTVVMALLAFAYSGCAHDPGINQDDASGKLVSVARARVRPSGKTSAPTFWDAVSALDAISAEATARTISERFFARALRALISGDLGTAEVMFRSLIGDPDPLIRARARIGVTLALEAQGRWSELATLPRVVVASTDTAIAIDTTTDRAAVDAWAGVLRHAEPVEVSAPAAPQIRRLTQSAIGTPIIAVDINGHLRNFWFDTGASMSLIASDVARKCGIVPIATDTLAIAAAAGRVAARPAIADVIQIGSITVRHLPVALLDPAALRLDHRTIDGRITPVRMDGVLGSDVLRRLNVVIDVAAGTVALSRPERNASKKRELMWIGFPVVRLLTRNGKPVLFGLDTGADSTVVTDAWLDKTPDPSLAPGKAELSGLGEERAQGLPLVRRVVVSDGKYALRMRDVPIVSERRETFVTLDGVLGANVLASATIRMDITNGVFEIRSPGLAPFGSDTGFVRVKR